MDVSAVCSPVKSLLGSWEIAACQETSPQDWPGHPSTPTAGEEQKHHVNATLSKHERYVNVLGPQDRRLDPQGVS